MYPNIHIKWICNIKKTHILTANFILVESIKLRAKLYLLKNTVNIWKLTVKIIGNIDPGFKDLNLITYMVFLLRIPKDSYVSIVLWSWYRSTIIIRDDFLITNYK